MSICRSLTLITSFLFFLSITLALTHVQVWPWESSLVGTTGDQSGPFLSHIAGQSDIIEVYEDTHDWRCSPMTVANLIYTICQTTFYHSSTIFVIVLPILYFCLHSCRRQKDTICSLKTLSTSRKSTLTVFYKSVGLINC
jgi:hypothetical protein